MAEIAPLSLRSAPIALRSAILVLPLHADEPSGDAAMRFDLPTAPGGPAPQALLAIVDGLGHGRDAAMAAQAALDVLASEPSLPFEDQFARLEARLTSTRGAAIGLVHIAGRSMQHAGIGNTRAVHLRGDTATRLPSQNGIVGGGQALHVAVNTLTLAPDDWLLLFTDGIDERVQVPVQLPEWRRAPDIFCRHLVAHWRAARDDVGVMVVSVDAAGKGA